MPYEIVIKKTETVKTMVRGSYAVMKEKYATYEELQAMVSDDERSDYKRQEDGTYKKNIYGYHPDVESSKEVETEVYKQRIENLDLVSVINAVNRYLPNG